MRPSGGISVNNNLMAERREEQEVIPCSGIADRLSSFGAATVRERGKPRPLPDGRGSESLTFRISGGKARPNIFGTIEKNALALPLPVRLGKRGAKLRDEPVAPKRTENLLPNP